MTTTLAPTEQRFVLDDADWELYEAILKRVGDRHVFVTYDQGRLEMMSPSWRHDKRARRLGLFLFVLAGELDIEIEGGGTTTFRREDLDKGLEADQCFYVANVNKVRGKQAIDLAIDPPPDLAIEVEITHRLLNRRAIYAALGVPELWVDDGKVVRVLCLEPDQQYRESSTSKAFPAVPMNRLAGLLDEGEAMAETSWGRRVREWIAEHVR